MVIGGIALGSASCGGFGGTGVESASRRVSCDTDREGARLIGHIIAMPMIIAKPMPIPPSIIVTLIISRKRRSLLSNDFFAGLLGPFTKGMLSDAIVG
jgi:hypothetical protein